MKQLAIGTAAFVLLEERAEQGRGGHEELDPALVHGKVRIAEVHVEDAQRLRPSAAQRSREGGDDAQHGEARAGRRRRRGIPHDALVLLERAPHDRAAHLLALFRREGALVAAGVDHAHAAVGLLQQDHAAIGAEQIDDDVEALVDGQILLERHEGAIEEAAHVAPHIFVRESLARGASRSLRHQCLGFTNSMSH